VLRIAKNDGTKENKENRGQKTKTTELNGETQLGKNREKKEGKEKRKKIG